jgi:hypothetical protein
MSPNTQEENHMKPEEIMNVFILDVDPNKSARHYADGDIPRAIQHTAQLLSTAHAEIGGKILLSKNVPDAVLYPHTAHIYHPFAVWTRDTKVNYWWMWRFMFALTNEFQLRFSNMHRYARFDAPRAYEHGKTLVEQLRTLPVGLKGDDLTDFPNCVPERFQGESLVWSYREYYRTIRRSTADWSPPRIAPAWFNINSYDTTQNKEIAQ